MLRSLIFCYMLTLLWVHQVVQELKRSKHGVINTKDKEN
jgi:hypothetical protein